jgi:hypothetical protein
MTARRKSTIVGQFIPHRLELIESPAWHVLSLSVRRVLERIEIEMCHNGDLRANGQLVVTYGDFERFGIHANAVAPAIREVVALGLVVVTEQGNGGNAEFRKPSKYRLTYICTKATNHPKYPDQPTDDWKRIDTTEAAEHIASMARDAGGRPPKKQKAALGKRSVSPSFSEGENGKVPPSENVVFPCSQSLLNPRVLSISPVGAGILPTERSEALAPNSSAYGYTSSDGTVVFTAREIAKLEEDAYALKQVYGMICELAESRWAAEIDPHNRKQAIRNTVIKRHNEKVSKRTPAPKDKLGSREERSLAVQEEWQRMRDREEEQKRWVTERKLEYVRRRTNGGAHEEIEENKDVDID